MVVLGALGALALAAVGAFRHVGAAYGSGHSLVSGPFAITTGGGGGGYSAGFYLAVLVVLTAAGALSLIAYAVRQSRREPARVRVPASRRPETRDPDEWRRERRD